MKIIFKKPDLDADTHAGVTITVNNDMDVKLRNYHLGKALKDALEYLFKEKCEVEVDFDWNAVDGSSMEQLKR